MITTPDYDRIAALLEQEARIKLELAQEFRSLTADTAQDVEPIRPLNLGSLQTAIFGVLLTADDRGYTPREITKRLERGDEPNVRMALSRMQERGVVELVVGFATQRWQLTVLYRPTH